MHSVHKIQAVGADRIV